MVRRHYRRLRTNITEDERRWMQRLAAKLRKSGYAQSYAEALASSALNYSIIVKRGDDIRQHDPQAWWDDVDRYTHAAELLASIEAKAQRGPSDAHDEATEYADPALERLKLESRRGRGAEE